LEGFSKETVVRTERKIFFLDIVLDFCFENLKGLATLEGLLKETAVRKERKIFFQTFYWISTLRTFGIVRRNSCPTRKKNFLSDIILDFYFKNLERPA
jgi:hypothetical protein